jgi:serine/threonine protein kinase
LEVALGSQRFNVEELFLQAVEKDPAQRQAFLEAACADGKVRTRVQALLKAHDSAGDFLDAPAITPSPLADTAKNRASDTDPTSVHEPLEFLAPCDTPDRLGLLAHYEILEILGRGGMATVLRAVDAKLNRVVAIKVMAPQLAADAMSRKRFHREAQAAAAVRHDNVVAIHAVDEWKGLPYLVMECISGQSLQQRIDDGGASQPTQILRLGLQIASGLAAAHAQGLVHRDIKPANILLESGTERVKITDFGLARSIDDVRITQAGAVYGTPQYMSPEQAQGERVDQRSDLFSLGSVLYAMCTGLPPFGGDTGLAVLRRVCDDTPPPIREVNPDIPAALAEIVNKLMAKNPDARFQSAGEAAELFGRYLAHLEHDPLTPFQTEGQPQPPAMPEERPDGGGEKSGRQEHRAARSRLRWPRLAGAAVLLAAIVVPAVLEATGITNWTGLAEGRVTSASGEDSETPRISPAVPDRSKKYAPGAVDRPVKVFIMAGDSNMAGRALARLLKANPARTKEYFQHLLDNGRYVIREDVWIKNLAQKGDLTAGFGQTPERIGPELEFGHVIGDYFEEQVLLIKISWGGHRLSAEFRSPSSGPIKDAEFLEVLRKELQGQKPDATLADAQAHCGAGYRDMLTEIRQTLANLGEHFPAYQGQGFELAGFVWFSGWNDLIHYRYTYAYTEHLGNFIRDVRADLKAPNLPFVIGQLGVNGGSAPGTNDLNFRIQQAAVANLPGFAGNVKVVVTDPFWDHEADAVYKKGWKEHLDEWEQVGSDFPYHYLGSAKTTCQIGKAFGEAMIELLSDRAKH